MKKIYFVAGLPRAGSTLLCNILNQHPNIYGSASSPLLDFVRLHRNSWMKNPFAKAMDEEEALIKKLGAIRGMMSGMYEGFTDAPIIFDKNRGWPTMFEFLSTVMSGRENVKMVICVRDLRDIVASFERLFRKTSETGTTTQEMYVGAEYRTALERAKYCCNPQEPLGYATRVTTDLFSRGFKDNVIVVEYDKLTTNPGRTMTEIYQFLGIEPHEHDFDNVEQVTKEDDRIHGFKGLHDIMKKVTPQPEQWKKIYDNTVKQTPFWASLTKEAKFWKALMT